MSVSVVSLDSLVCGGVDHGQRLMTEFFPKIKKGPRGITCWKSKVISVPGVRKIVRKTSRCLVQSFIDEIFSVLKH